MPQYSSYLSGTLYITPVGFTAMKNNGLIDPKRHLIHSASWQPSLFSKESTLSLLHSSRASPSAWWIMSSVSSKTRLIPDRYTALLHHDFDCLQISAGTNVSTSDRIELSVHDEMSRVILNLQLFLKTCMKLSVFPKNLRCYIVFLS